MTKIQKKSIFFVKERRDSDIWHIRFHGISVS